MRGNMQTSENGIASIKRNEGFSAIPYEDNGHMAWGYGHDQEGNEVIPASVTQDQADFILRRDLASRYEPVLTDWLSGKGLNATQNQFDALIDFAYNLGTGSMLTMLAHGWDQVPTQIIRWNHVNGKVNAGLSERRTAEAALFSTPVPEAA